MSLSKENLIYLEIFLESFKDQSFNMPSKKNAGYQQVTEILKSTTTVDQELLDALLQACTEDLKQFVYVPSVLNTIVAILNKKENFTSPYILASLKATVHIMNAIATEESVGALAQRVKSLKTMCVDTVLAYPDSALEALVVTEHGNILNVIDIYCSSIEKPKCTIYANRMLKRLLMVLSPETKSKFVTAGVDVWFKSVVPTVILSLPVVDIAQSSELLDTLELLTACLIPVHYSDNRDWKLIVENVYNAKKTYPTLMRNLLMKGSDAWHRLWIVLVKLLKEELTVVIHRTISPINSMLPVVEAAFKMDMNNRLLAFKCWEVLINIFALEGNKHVMMKRLNLLIIPLITLSPKIEQTGKVKINIWWHLIRMFHDQVKYSDLIKIWSHRVLMPFIDCCFGHPEPESDLVITGLLSADITAQCVEMLVEIFGHVNCADCVTVPKLKCRMIDVELLMHNWKEWLHALKTAFKFAVRNESDNVIQQLSCLWQSVLLTVAEIPESCAQSEMLRNLLDELELLVECNFDSETFTENIFNVMILPIFNRESESIMMLFRLITLEQNEPILRILKIILAPVMKSVLNRKTVKDMKVITDLLVDTKVCPPNDMIEWFLENLPEEENSAVLWCALIESLSQCYFNLNDAQWLQALMWPLLHEFALVSNRSATVYLNWKKLFGSWLTKSGYDVILANLLPTPLNTAAPALDLKLCVAFMLLKHLFLRKHFSAVEKNIFVLRELLTNNIQSAKELARVFPIIIDTMSAIIIRLTQDVDVDKAGNILVIVHLVLSLSVHDEQLSNDVSSHLFEHLNDLFKINEYQNHKRLIVDDLLNYLNVNADDTQNKANALYLLRTFLKQTKDTDNNMYAKIAAVINTLQNMKVLKNSQTAESATTTPSPAAAITDKQPPVSEIACTPITHDSNESNVLMLAKNNLAEPKIAGPSKKSKKKEPAEPKIAGPSKNSKKKEPTILNTVVENGEEYAVVQSNWKFDPRKLTDHQKEKLVKKSEDIPALYQDLSQSLDGTLNHWKTHATTTSSMSKNFDITQTSPEPKTLENVSKVSPLSKVCSPATHTASINDDHTRISPPEVKIIFDQNVSFPDSIVGSKRLRQSRMPHRFRNDDFHGLEVVPLTKRRSGSKDTGGKSNVKPVPLNKENSEENIKISDMEKLCDEQCSSIALASKPNQNNGLAKTSPNCNDDPKLDTNVDKDFKDSMTPNSSSKIGTKRPKVSKEIDVYKKKCRIEKQLLIDTVQGHPLLKTTAKRINRRRVIEQNSIDKQANVKKVPKCNSKTKDNANVDNTHPIQTKIKNGQTTTRLQNCDTFHNTSSDTSGVVDSQDSQVKPPCNTAQSQEKLTTSANTPTEKALVSLVSPTTSVFSQNEPSISLLSSPDLASSEDIIESSPNTSVSVTSSKTIKHTCAVKSDEIPDVIQEVCRSQNLLELLEVPTVQISLDDSTSEDSDYIQPIKQNGLVRDRPENNLADNKDTKSVENSEIDEDSDCVIISIEDSQFMIGTEHSATEIEIAKADTEPFEEFQTLAQVHSCSSYSKNNNDAVIKQDNVFNTTNDDLTQTLPENDTVSSPLKDQVKKNEEFLNDTLEVSPIKSLSPIRDEQSPSPTKNSDYFLVRLTSPVQSNGEPLNDERDSPEIFTEYKTSPEKSNQSLPKEEMKASNTSSSPSLSLKKNITKVSWGGGRAAQIMSMCENLRSSHVQHPVIEDRLEESDSEAHFPQFTRPIPTAACSPSGPILKRKLAVPIDDSISPARKQKRVSFHDPPISTIIPVQKYLDPCGTGSPQNSATKRQERLARGFSRLRSHKRLDTVLTTAIESFTNETPTTSDSELTSIEQTPVAEVVMTSDLNNRDPIYPDLLDCTDPISKIAGELSSPAMKDLLIKELTGKIETVGDLAKLTELEVNRLSIKAPKIKVVIQELMAYAAMRNSKTKSDITEESNWSADQSIKFTDMEVQTTITLTEDSSMQTAPTSVTCTSSQTNIRELSNVASQTKETGAKSTEEMLASCLADRPVLMEQLGKHLSFDDSLGLLMSKMNGINRDAVINRMINIQGTPDTSNPVTSFTEYLCQRFQSTDLILLCAKILEKVHEHANEKKINSV